jgi:ABC-type dipeptide/oligopeptide/nickel transport system permease subunit
MSQSADPLIVDPIAETNAVISKLRNYGRILSFFYRKKTLGAIGLTIILIIGMLAVFAPLFARYDPSFIFKTDNPNYKTNPSIADLAKDSNASSPIIVTQLTQPDSEHWFGTSRAGHDIYARIIYGTRTSLMVGLIASVIAVGLGIVIGGATGYYLGWLDLLVQRLIDTLQALPSLVLLLLIGQTFDASLRNVIITMGIIGLPITSRLIRSAVLAIRASTFVEAATALGASDSRIMFRHVLPNIGSVVIISFTIGIGAYILFEATLSFLGVGPSGVISWGRMVNEGRASIDIHPWLTVFSGSALSLTVVAFNLFGDAIRDVLDPRLRGSK